MEARLIQIPFVLNEFLLSFTDFSHFTRSFSIFAEPNGEKLNI